jgi:hypothetical protein
MSIHKLSVDLTPEVTVEYTIETYNEYFGYQYNERKKVIEIKNEKYAPLTLSDYRYQAFRGIVDDDSFGYHNLFDFHENNDKKRITNLVNKLKLFCNTKLTLADEINYYPSRLRAMILSEFLGYCKLTHSWYVDKIDDFDFSALHGLDLEYFIIDLNYKNELLHDKLVPEIVKAICSVNFTEEIVLKHIKNYPATPKNKVKVFLPVEEKMGLIKMVKSVKGRKEMQKFIFSTRDTDLIKKVIQEYKLNPDTIIDNALKINDGILISEMYKLLSKKKKDTVTDEIIKTMPKLVGTNVTLELLESLPEVHWTMYGPEPKMTQYYSTEPLPKCLKPETLPEVTRFILEKVPNVIDKEWLKNYLKVKKVDKNFLENMVVFNDYFSV